MCVIVAKKKGVEAPSFEILKNCFNNNPDGAGFMYLNPKTNRVQIHKGFMAFEQLQKKLEEVYNELGNTKDIPFVYHFRIGTSGGNLPENTHPYPLGRNISNMKKLDFTCSIGVAHNGIITKFTPKEKNNKRKMNDTQLYIYSKMYKYAFNSKYKTSKIQELIENETGSKFAILDTSGDIQLIGKFNENKGVFFSNYSYEDNKDYLKYLKEDFYGYNYGSYGYGLDIPVRDYIELQETISKGKFISEDCVIANYEYDEELIPENSFTYLEIDGEIFYVDYDNLCLMFVTDWYDILSREDYINQYYKTIDIDDDKVI